ncbi:LysR family transcriptional regulator [Proteocatella sphenisci]|uniref:LysR family transcriptional regulator n=1 Tax=Proteocatella sphenisci TaxID=181070 RepID=UPI00146B4F7D|nr:LysR family transcriptional regulator [Proteocatella sphenisci]
MNKGITLLQIEYFIAVARSLNFTDAAKSMYVAQPSLSKQIALLEKEIGVQLFNRSTRGVRLTPAGAVLYKEMGNVLETIHEAIEKSSQKNLGEQGSITIGCLDTMDTDNFLPPFIKSFKENHRGISMVFERHSFKALREKLMSGSLDVIFTLSFEIDDSLDIVYDTIFKSRTSIVMSTTNPLSDKENLTFKDIRNEDFVFISRDESPRGFDGVISLCREHGFAPNIVRQLPNIGSLLLCVESGIGISILDSNIRRHNSSLKHFEIENDQVDVVMAWKKDNVNPSVSLFTNSVLSREIENS